MSVLQGQQCSLSVASNGDVIAAAPTEAAIAASTTASSTASKAESKAAATAAAAFELKGSEWQAVVQEQGTRSIRVLQEAEFNPEVRQCGP